MKKKAIVILSVTLMIFLITGCASSYKKINIPMEMTKKGITPTDDEISIQFITTSLIDSNNERYFKYCNKNQVNLLAVRIKNNSDKPIYIGNNLKVYNNGNEVNIQTPESYLQLIKQPKLGYIFYSLIWLNVSHTETDSYGHQEMKVSSYPVGVLFTLFNIILASVADSDFKNDVLNNYLINKTIEPNTEKYGFLLFQAPIGGSIKIELQE